MQHADEAITMELTRRLSLPNAALVSAALVAATLVTVALATVVLSFQADNVVENPLLVPAPGSPVKLDGRALAAGDLNGDRVADLVLIVEDSLQVHLGHATRSWQKEPDVTTKLPVKCSEIALADLDHDAQLDVVLADHDTYAVTVMRGDGTGRFQSFPGSSYWASPATRCTNCGCSTTSRLI